MRTDEQYGFTLIELMIVIAIVGVLLLVVTPNFGRFVADGRVNATKDKLVSSISLARSEAIKRGDQVVICRANAAGDSCAGSSTNATSTSWSNGWLVFADEDSDEVLDAGELIRVQTDLDSKTTVTYSRGDIIVYSGQGMLITGSSGDETFIIGDSADNTVGTGLSVRSTGRIRSCADWNVSTSTCDDS